MRVAQDVGPTASLKICFAIFLGGPMGPIHPVWTIAAVQLWWANQNLSFVLARHPSSVPSRFQCSSFSSSRRQLRLGCFRTRFQKVWTFLLETSNLEQCTHKSGASKNYGCLFFWNRTQKSGASKKMEPFFLENTSLSNVPTSQGFPKKWGLFC